MLQLSDTLPSIAQLSWSNKIQSISHFALPSAQESSGSLTVFGIKHDFPRSLSIGSHTDLTKGHALIHVWLSMPKEAVFLYVSQPCYILASSSSNWTISVCSKRSSSRIISSIKYFLGSEGLRFSFVLQSKEVAWTVLMKMPLGASLVTQWLRIHLPMQGTWVWSLGLVWEDSACCRATKLIYHNYWAWACSATREATTVRSLHTATREQPLLAATRESPEQPNK